MGAVFKKCLVMAVAMSMMLFANGVGECRSDAKGAPCSPEEAVLAYAQVYAYGSTDYAERAGLAQEDINEVRQLFANKFRDSFKEFCLSDESLKKLTDTYLEKRKSSMDLSTKLKVDNSKQPVVTLTAKILEEKSFEEQATNDQNIQAFAFAIMGMKNDGKTEADLRADATVQATAIDCITKFIDTIDFGAPKSLDVTCTKTKGADGKKYWAPKETDALYQFITAD